MHINISLARPFLFRKQSRLRKNLTHLIKVLVPVFVSYDKIHIITHVLLHSSKMKKVHSEVRTMAEMRQGGEGGGGGGGK